MNAEWIDASSKMPTPLQLVLGFRAGGIVFPEGGSPCVCYTNKDGDWFSDWHCNVYNITHWMPLPESPPKRESSFEKWWYQLNPSPTYGMDVRQVGTGLEIRKPYAKIIWDAAIAASKRPDFVE